MQLQAEGAQIVVEFEQNLTDLVYIQFEMFAFLSFEEHKCLKSTSWEF